MDDTGIAIFSKKEDLAPDLKASNVETTQRKVRRFPIDATSEEVLNFSC